MYGDTYYPNTQVNDRLISEIQSINDQIQRQNQKIESLRLGQKEVITPVLPTPVDPGTYRGTIETTPNERVTGFVTNKGYGAFIGTNFGDAPTVNLGARGYFGFTNTPIIFMPELYFAMGDNNGFGVSANGILPFNISSIPVTPYVGLGVGLHKINKEFSFNSNVIVGASYRLGVGSIFADYTAIG